MKDVRRFLGIVQYYRNLLQNRSHILTPLTELTSGVENKNIECNESCELAFEHTKKLLARDMMLLYPILKKIVLHTDASNLQLGAVIL